MNAKKHRLRTINMNVILVCAVTSLNAVAAGTLPPPSEPLPITPEPRPIPLPGEQNISLDGSLGKALTLSGPDYLITENLGQRHGVNLFHSFSEFSLSSGESAIFSGAKDIQNIVSRVTGSNPSNINGTITSAINGADFYFINPNGVIFGADAQLVVSGSFYASTANYIVLSDGGRFDAGNPVNSVLTSAAPSAFGFVSNQPAAIDVQGSYLQVNDGKNIGLIGGDITIAGADGSLLDQFADTNLYAANGRIELISVASATEVGITPAGLQTDAVAEFSDITLRDGAVIDASGDPGGTVYIRGGNLVISDSLIINGNEGTADHTGRAIDIEVQGDALIEHKAENVAKGYRPVSGIEAPILGAGDGGDIHIVAKSLIVTGNPQAAVQAKVGTNRGIPRGSFANIAADKVQNPLATGKGGDIEISANEIYLKDNSLISTETNFDGDAGNISLTANRLYMLTEQGNTEIRSVARESGLFKGDLPPNADAGDISIVADEVVLKNQADILATYFSQGIMPGHAGNIFITANALQVLDGARIEAIGASTDGNGGYITINTDDLRVQGFDETGGAAAIVAGTEAFGSIESGDVDITTNTLTLTDGGTIANFNDADGQGGDVNINAKEIDISRTGVIVTGFSLFFDEQIGSAGNVNIEADSIRIHSAVVPDDAPPEFNPDPRFPSLNNPTGIITVAYPTVQGAGNIDIKTNTLEILDGGEINATTWSKARGGDITIDANNILLSGSDTERNVNSRIISASNTAPDAQIAAFAGGDGGDISITTKNLTLTNRAEITASSTSPGDAGNITINASNDILLTNAQINTNAGQSADGGNITVNATNTLYLKNSRINASVAGTTGNGGNINIDPIFVILDNSSIVAEAIGGAGGNIHIVAQNFIASPDSRLSASSQSGVSGDVSVTTPNRDLLGELEAVPEPAPDASRYFRSDCVAVGSGFSRFIVARAEAVSAGTYEPLASNYIDQGSNNEKLSIDEQQQKSSGKPLLVLSKKGMDCLADKRI